FHELSGLLRHQEGLCSTIHLARYLIARGDDLLACDVSGYYGFAEADKRDHLNYRQQVLSVRLGQEELVA
ncbi:MAG: hypothetical protein H5T63_08805, partial [Chloroflexi bacterium]|nr:hypothetical protein [Chloroflexota bacterium]